MTTNDDVEAKTEELLQSVYDRDSFLVFLRQLYDDWEDSIAKEREHPSNPYDSGANGWQNGSVGAFLEAALAWAETCAERNDKGLPYPTLSREPSWESFAYVLMAGKTYE